MVDEATLRFENSGRWYYTTLYYWTTGERVRAEGPAVVSASYLFPQQPQRLYQPTAPSARTQRKVFLIRILYRVGHRLRSRPLNVSLPVCVFHTDAEKDERW